MPTLSAKAGVDNLNAVEFHVRSGAIRSSLNRSSVQYSVWSRGRRCVISDRLSLKSASV